MADGSDMEKARAKSVLLDEIRAAGLNVQDYRFLFVKAWNPETRETILRYDAYPKEHSLAKMPGAESA